MTLHTGRLRAHLSCAFLLLFTSCVDNDYSGSLSQDDKGLVMLSLKPEIEVKSSEDVIDYNFRFVGVGEYGTSQYYRYGDITWPMEWYFGIFRLQAESCTLEQSDEGYGKVRYEGISEPFAVMNGQTATAYVLCSVANIRVGVNFEDKMYLGFKDFKLEVETVTAPVYEEDESGDRILVVDETPVRRLEFDSVIKSGYFNLSSVPMLLKYTLWVMPERAEDYVIGASGYFSANQDSSPSVLERGSYITLNVKYVGDVEVTQDIKFIVSGERKSISNEVILEDYVEDQVKEDK